MLTNSDYTFFSEQYRVLGLVLKDILKELVKMNGKSKRTYHRKSGLKIVKEEK